MPTALSSSQLKLLRPLEEGLKFSVVDGDDEGADKALRQIIVIFGLDKKHPRLIRAKLWAYEAALNKNNLSYAESGFISVRRQVSRKSRLYLEATILLSVCLLRQKKIDPAKHLIKEVVVSLNNIQSDRRRHQFQRRFVERVEEECILSELIGSLVGSLDPREIQQKAILLVQQKSEDEIYAEMGNALPQGSVLTLSAVRNFSILLLPPPDRKLLPAPEVAQKPVQMGKRTMSALKRIGWRTFCHSKSPLYRLWSENFPEMLNGAHFATGISMVFGQWKIGITSLATTFAASAMRAGVQEFCDRTKPQGLMIDVKDKD